MIVKKKYEHVNLDRKFYFTPVCDSSGEPVALEAHDDKRGKRAFTDCGFRVDHYIKENVVPALPVSVIYGALFLFRTLVSMVVL